MVNKKYGKQNRKNCGIYKRHSLRTIIVCRFEIIDGVKYVYCIKHAYKCFLREQVGFAAVHRRLRQCVSCWFILTTFTIIVLCDALMNCMYMRVIFKIYKHGNKVSQYYVKSRTWLAAFFNWIKGRLDRSTRTIAWAMRAVG